MKMSFGVLKSSSSNFQKIFKKVEEQSRLKILIRSLVSELNVIQSLVILSYFYSKGDEHDSIVAVKIIRHMKDQVKIFQRN